jgi:hypothetical protein
MGRVFSAFGNLNFFDRDEKGREYANATPEFWTYWKVGETDLRKVGISVQKRHETWFVYFDERMATNDELKAAVARIREAMVKPSAPKPIADARSLLFRR